MQSDESTPPIRISKSTWVSAPVYVIISSLLALVGAVMAYGSLVSTGERHGKAISDLQSITAKHDDRISRLERNQTKIEVMQNDIAWIRKSLEAEKARR